MTGPDLTRRAVLQSAVATLVAPVVVSAEKLSALSAPLGIGAPPREFFSQWLRCGTAYEQFRLRSLDIRCANGGIEMDSAIQSAGEGASYALEKMLGESIQALRAAYAPFEAVLKPLTEMVQGNPFLRKYFETLKVVSDARCRELVKICPPSHPHHGQLSRIAAEIDAGSVLNAEDRMQNLFPDLIARADSAVPRHAIRELRSLDEVFGRSWRDVFREDAHFEFDNGCIRIEAYPKGSHNPTFEWRGTDRASFEQSVRVPETLIDGSTLEKATVRERQAIAEAHKKAVANDRRSRLRALLAKRPMPYCDDDRMYLDFHRFMSGMPGEKYFRY